MSGELSAFLSALCYALSYMLLRKAQSVTDQDELDNGLFTILFVCSIVLTAGLIAKIILDHSPVVGKDDWGMSVVYCILAGVIGTLFGRLALFAAIARIGATRGVLINAMAPLVTLAIAISVLGEKFEPFDIWGMCLLAIGLFLLISERLFFPTRFMKGILRQGIIIAVIATLFQGVGHTFRKVGIDTSMTPLFAAGLDTVSAFIVYVFLLSVFGRLKRVIRNSVQSLNLYIVTAGVLSGAAVVLFFAASDAIPVSTVSMITAIQPVIVALLSSIFMKKLERLTWVTVVCSIIVTAGIALIGI